MAKRLLVLALLALLVLSVVRLAPEVLGGGKCKYCREHIHKLVCYAIVGVDASGGREDERTDVASGSGSKTGDVWSEAYGVEK